jgi:hypothetical protein
MANPNIVNVTSILGETVVGALTTTLTTVLLTNAASSGKVYKVNSILISNVDGTNAADVTLDLSLNELGTSAAYSIATTIAVPADATLSVIDKTNSFYLTENRSLIGGASANGDLEYLISYEVIN